MENFLLISDAAKEVQVESHVLRYWEEELHLPIRRNELGHRYYTKEDVERFKQIKGMKERGLQLKAIKMILKDGKIDVMMPEEEKEALKKQEEAMQKKELQDGTTQVLGFGTASGGLEENADAQGAVTSRAEGSASMEVSTLEAGSGEIIREASPEEKAKRLQWLLQQMIRDTLQENNKELSRDIKESVVKELDYQFRVQEEREDERDRIREERDELHYQKLDELLRRKNHRRRAAEQKPEKPVKAKTQKLPREKKVKPVKEKKLRKKAAKEAKEEKRKEQTAKEPEETKTIVMSDEKKQENNKRHFIF